MTNMGPLADSEDDVSQLYFLNALEYEDAYTRFEQSLDAANSIAEDALPDLQNTQWDDLQQMVDNDVASTTYTGALPISHEPTRRVARPAQLLLGTNQMIPPPQTYQQLVAHRVLNRILQMLDRDSALIDRATLTPATAEELLARWATPEENSLIQQATLVEQQSQMQHQLESFRLGPDPLEAQFQPQYMNSFSGNVTQQRYSEHSIHQEHTSTGVPAPAFPGYSGSNVDSFLSKQGPKTRNASVEGRTKHEGLRRRNALTPVESPGVEKAQNRNEYGQPLTPGRLPDGSVANDPSTFDPDNLHSRFERRQACAPCRRGKRKCVYGDDDHDICGCCKIKRNKMPDLDWAVICSRDDTDEWKKYLDANPDTHGKAVRNGDGWMARRQKRQNEIDVQKAVEKQQKEQQDSEQRRERRLRRQRQRSAARPRHCSADSQTGSDCTPS